MAFVVNNGFEIPEIDDGTYPARLIAHTESQSEYQGKMRDQFRLDFEITSGEYEGTKLAFWVNRKRNANGEDIVNTKSNYYKVIVALNGGDDLPVGFAGDLDDFHGSDCRIEVENKFSPKANEDRPYITKVRGPATARKKRVGTEAF